MNNSENKSSANGEEEEKPAEIESQFILRLPHGPANALRNILRKSETKSVSKDKIKIDLDTASMRRATLQFDNYSLPARIYDLPSVIESYKTFDRKVFYKVADINHIMKCAEDEAQFDAGAETDDPQEKPRLDRDGRDKKYLFPHGLTPCLKNSRKRRFRKTLRKRHTEGPTVESEVKMLLKTDAEAINSRFELVEDDRIDQKPNIPSSDDRENSKDGDNSQMGAMLAEYIFGHVSSSSEEEENEDFSNVKTNESKPLFATDNMKDLTCNDSSDSIKLPVKEEEEDEPGISFSQEAEAAQQNLGCMLQNCTIDEDKTQVLRHLNKLEDTISNLQLQREALENETSSIGNQALKDRCLDNIESLRAEEAQKKAEYDKIVASMPNM